MASTKSKTTSTMKVRRITNKKERKSGSLFHRLKTDEWMKGFALFSPDPEAAKNDYWFEYLEHYDNSNNQYVPCVGDDCYMCELGDNPSPRALTLWYFPDEQEKDKFKVFKFNGYLIRDFAEIDEEEGGVLGRRFRIKRLSDKGEYRATPQGDKPLKAGEIKTLKKDAGEASIDFEALTLRQAKNALAKVSAADALTDVEDDDDDDDEEETTTKRGRPKSEDKKSKAEVEEEDDEDEDEDEEEDEEEEEDSDDDDSDDEDEDDDEEDEDEEADEDDEEESDDDEDEEDEEDSESDEMKGQTVTVTSTSEKDEIISGKLDGEGKTQKLYVGQNLDVDWDKVKKGVAISVDAKKDDEDDWVLTKVAVKRKAKAK